MKAINLKTAHLVNPLGIDIPKPLLTWTCDGGIHQTAYQIVASIDEREVWNSGKVALSAMQAVYDGPAESRARVKWSVTLWDENDAKGEESSAWFEYALLDKSDFKAKWINPEVEPFDTKKNQPASVLVGDFRLDSKENARIYATARGLYVLRINGRRVTENVLTPGTSEYWFRHPYQTFDVSDYLRVGENRIEVTLGDGWWRGCNGNTGTRNVFGTDIALWLQLEVNKEIKLVTDNMWLASQSGPIRFNDLQLGERVDARMVPTDWHYVKLENFGYDKLLSANTLPLKEKESFSAKLIRTPSGKTVLDFGQNMAGYVSFKLSARAGQTIKLTHGEYIGEDGEFSDSNLQTVGRKSGELHQVVEYICTDGVNEYTPTLCIFGFQYVLVETDIAIDGSEFSAHAVYSDMEETASFSCDLPLVNQLFHNAVWSEKSNFVDIPTDCPHREKSGYSGDIQVFSNTALYLMDCYAVLQKWLLDQASTQFENGAVKQISPDNPKLGGSDGGSAWCDSLEIVPFNMFRRYGSLRLLERLYEPIKRWEDFCLTRAKEVRKGNESIPREIAENLVDTGFHWGEWCEPDSTNKLDHQHTKDGYNTDVATAYLSYGTHILSEIADILGKKEDAAHYRAESEKAKNAYRRMFTRDGVIESKRQCQYIRPIILGLLNSEEERQSAADALNELVIKKAYHLNTGFLTTFELCRVLTDYGHSDTAYSLLLQDSRPSWLYAVKKGATTIPESWNFITDDGKVHDSFNHYSYGSISSWLIDRAAGIRVENGQILIQPYPDPRLGSMDCSYLSPLGRIRSAWRYEGDRVLYEIDIPCNAQAALLLPGREKQILGPGQYRF